ncbi:MAG: histidine kinase [Gemmatimonadota bacterium]|nr:MAG: histidine kinase [Gemmatimonadota bacterium]
MKQRFVDTLKRLWQNRISRHVLYWLIIYAAFYAIIRPFESHIFALRLATFFAASGPIPVYFHLVIVKRYFEQRRYVAYIVGLAIVIALSSTFSNFLFRMMEKDPDSHSSGLGFAVMYIVVSTGFRYYGRGVKQQYRLQEAEFKHLQTELALLKSQIDPHFFFNTLNNLYALSLEKSDRVPGVILKLSELMRYVMDSSQRKTVPLEEELRFVKNYVELEKLRFSGTPDIEVRIAGTMNGKYIAPMLLVPFVENSFKHGMSNTAKGGFVSVVSQVQGDDFYFTVENSKPEGAVNDERGSEGMGLLNVKRRLELLYHGSGQLSIKEDEKRYKVELRIRL